MYPVRLGPTEALVPVGIILVVCSIVVVAMAVREISKAKTASDVRNPTTNLITSGIFVDGHVVFWYSHDCQLTATPVGCGDGG